MSKKALFTDSWFFGEFPLETSYEVMNSSSLSPVELPHDWMIYHVSDLYKDSIGFYKKTFSIAKSTDSHFYLYFDGVYMDCHIYINDSDIFSWKYGYSSFEVDITPYINNGQNIVCVTCNYKAPNTRWYSGAGIYRNVYLCEKSSARISSFGTYISTEKTDNGFMLTSDVKCVSDTPCLACIKHTLYEGSTETFSKAHSVCSFEDNVSLQTKETVFKAKKEIVNPRVWDIDSPNLYTLEITLIVDGKVIDSVLQTIGFRTISFDSNTGFYLNGRNVKINGVCQHHDLGALGSAMNKNALRRQFEKLIKMGVNAIRTSHNMPAVELMDLADEMGILIYTESFDMWELSKTEFDYARFFPDWWEKDITNWVMRDCNHPSLIIWGIGNEIYDTHVGSGLKWTRLMRDLVRKLDYNKNAYISVASNYIEWDNAQACSDELDLSGYNYGERLYDLHHKKYPHWCIFGSETSSTVQSRGIYHFPYESRLLTYDDGQCSSLANCSTNWGAKDSATVIINHRDRDFAFGQFLWTGWDYIGEPTPYFSKNSFFGQIDTAGFEKDSYFQYQAEWTDYKKSPMIHLLPYWDFNDGQIIDVIAYTNAPSLELFLNGKSLGKQDIDHAHGTKLCGLWKAPYKKGELVVLAYDENGKEIAKDVSHSFDDPSSISLSCNKNVLNADGKDLCFIEISVLDENNIPVANARNRMNISVEGPVRLVGLDNGDSTDYEEYKCFSRKLFSGKLLAIVASTYETGEAKITVSSNGLSSSSISLNTVSSDYELKLPFLDSCKEVSIPNHNEIPIRKISLTRSSQSVLSKESPDCDVEYCILPHNASYRDITFKALTSDGITANFVSLSTDEKVIHVHAFGDGEFRLTAFANNGKDYPEVISQLEFVSEGLGIAARNPYEMVPGICFDESSTDNCELSFLGGVFLPAGSDNHSHITFNTVDFGDFGSDEIVIPIFSFRDELGVEIFEGTYPDGKSLFVGTYKAKSIYNHYQENTFKLSKRLSGTKTITLAFTTSDRISVQGFYFKKQEKAYALLDATSCSRISGDSFSLKNDGIYSIGNNVTIDYDNMNFKNGINRVRIKGKSNNPVTSIHIMLINNDTSERTMVEIPHKDVVDWYEFPISFSPINSSVSFVFLPGSDFDFYSFEFLQ